MRAELRTALWLALRHHPLCDRFDADRFGPFCSGCVLFWPGFAVTLPVAVHAWLAGAGAWALLAAGAVLGAPQLLTVRWRFGRLARAAIKLLGGVAVAMAVVGILFLPAPGGVRLAIGLLMLASFAGLAALRARSVLATCHTCPWRRDWARCPGFAGTYWAPSEPARRPMVQASEQRTVSLRPRGGGAKIVAVPRPGRRPLKQ